MTAPAAKPDLRDAAVLAEQALGENLVWLADKFDLAMRQRDPETVRRLSQLNAAWAGLAKAI